MPTMREVQALRPAAAAVAIPATTRPAWGNPQRFLVTGLVLVLLAVIAAVILYRQFPSRLGGLRSPEAEQQRVKGLTTLETIWYFRQRILPGIEIPESPEVQRKRSMVYLGLAAVGGMGAIGLVLAGVGIAGIARRR